MSINGEQQKRYELMEKWRKEADDAGIDVSLMLDGTGSSTGVNGGDAICFWALGMGLALLGGIISWLIGMWVVYLLKDCSLGTRVCGASWVTVLGADLFLALSLYLGAGSYGLRGFVKVFQGWLTATVIALIIGLFVLRYHESKKHWDWYQNWQKHFERY